MNAKEAIKNLETMSDALSKASSNPKFYNTDYGYYLEQMSYQLYRDAAELKEIEHKYFNSLYIDMV